MLTPPFILTTVTRFDEMAEVLRELEQAAQLIMAPPSVVSQSQRQAAENVILTFRRSKSPFEACQFMLENSKSDYVLFQVASTVKEAMIREWTLLSPEQINHMRTFLMKYVTQNIGLSNYVREQMLQTVAVIYKRGTLDTKSSGREALFQDVSQLIASGNTQMQMIACSMLTALLNEYSGNAKTSAIGLSWNFHNECKRKFENNDLKQVFQFALQVLHQLVSSPDQMSREASTLLGRILAISEQVLSWDFSLARPVRSNFESVDSPALKPDRSWKGILLDKQVIELFFKIHIRVRHRHDLCHHVILCLSQLATLRGNIFTGNPAQVEYLHHFIQCVLHTLNSGEIQDHEALGLSGIFNNLINTHPTGIFVSLPGDVLSSFVTNLTNLTCHFCSKASLEEAMHKDDQQFMEAFSKLLDCWTTLLSRVESYPQNFFQQHANQIFNTYLQCHLSVPEGTRNQESSEDEEEIDELVEEDRVAFDDQLLSIGAISRQITEHSIPLVTRLLEDRVTKFHSILHQYQQQMVQGGGLNHNADIQSKILTNLYEDLHWLILTSGYMLADQHKGEVPCIPREIIAHSMKKSQGVNLEATQRLVSSPGDDPASLPGYEQADEVIRLSSSVLRLSEVERYAGEAKLTIVLSPQVASTVVWFMHRWLVSYLQLNEKNYTECSLALLMSLGHHSEGAQLVTRCLVQKVASNLAIWSSEEAVAKETASMFVALVQKTDRCTAVVKETTFWELAKHLSHNQPPFDLLSSEIQHLIMKALVLGGSSVSTQEVKGRFSKEILQPLQEHFKSLIQQENFVRKSQEQDVKSTMLTLLWLVRGVVEGSSVTTNSDLYQFTLPFLTESVALMKVYQNCPDVVEGIFQLHVEVCMRMLSFLNEQNTLKLFEVSLALLRMYTECNLGKRTREGGAEEDQYQDISLIMQLLTHLISKDLVDYIFSEEATGVGDHQNAVVSAGEIVLLGLNIVVPLIDAEILKLPNLCSQYYELITFVTEFNAEKVSDLPEALFRSLLGSIELGVTDFSVDIAKMCLESVTSLATFCIKTRDKASQALLAAMEHFLKVVVDVMFLESFDLDLSSVASEALYVLIACNKDKYSILVNTILNSQSEPAVCQRLIEAFNELTPPGMQMTINRQEKFKFQKRLEKFLLNVRSLLTVR
ncbi:exportin-4-like isoform X2 [Apostichopus japonicus]|uniref:exportin-4-like isoform X2 n=1 Tax=Stichopus japonicus TaxID=307972 RepID=UPI003AB907C2